jgi:parallel beta-helix repeat protein
MAKLASMILCAVMIADFAAVASINSPKSGSFNGPLGASPKTIWVDDDFADDPPNHKWNSVQEGVDDANNGDTVYVFNGTYHENVVVDKTVNLKGEDRRSTIIDGSGAKDVVYVSADWVNVTGFTVTRSGGANYDGIALFYVEKCYITDNIVSYNNRGIVLSYSSNNTVINNTASNNYHGLYVWQSNNTIIVNNTASNIWNDIFVRSSVGNELANNTMDANGIQISGDLPEHWNTHTIDTTNVVNGKPVYYWKNVIGGSIPSGAGQVILANCTGVAIVDRNISNVFAGIQLGFSSRNRMDNNTVTSNNWIGIGLAHSNNNTIINNNAPGNQLSIVLSNSNDNIVANNTATSNSKHGIALEWSGNNTIANNNVSNNREGVRLDFSTHNIITNNTASSNSAGGIYLWYSGHNTIAKNTAFECWSSIYIRGSHNNTVVDNIASSNDVGSGISIFISHSNTIANNTVNSNVYEGIQIDRANKNVITNNTVSNNLENGISLRETSGNTITGNTVSSNRWNGIQLYSSNENILSGNSVSSNNNYGIFLARGSVNNLIHHNNIMDNRDQALDANPANNDWHHPTLLEGNYWSDYTGLDDGSGTGKHAIAGDGIGDTLIPHPGTDYDFHPFVKEDGWIPENIPPVADAGSDQTVYVGDVVQFDGSGSYDPDAECEIMTVDSIGQVGEYTSLALDGNSNPHVSYQDRTNGYLKYAKWTGSTWRIEVVDDNGTEGYGTSLVLDSNGYPHISYMDRSKSNLKYAKWDGTTWSIETVDSTYGVGSFSSIALDTKEYSHIAYKDGRKDDLRYAKWNGAAWDIEIVDTAGNVGGDPSLALDRGDNPHISYLDASTYGDANLKYANWAGITWSIETVDWAGNVGRHSSMVLDKNEYPHISYQDAKSNWTNGDLKYASWNGSAWSIEVVDSSGNVGFYTSLALDKNGYQHMSYHDRESGDLKYAIWTGSSWYIETLDSVGDVGLYTSLSIDSQGYSHISYFDASNEDLKYLKKIGGIVSYDWDFGDGSPHGSGVRPTHIYSNPGIYNVTLTVTDAQGATDTDNCIITVLPKKQPPVAQANGPYFVKEGSPITLDASGSYDPDGDTLQYRWDLNNDGIWDSGWSSSPYLDCTWGDDYSGEVTVEVSDGQFTDTDTATIIVNNVAPMVELKILSIHVNVSLRIAGEKWHDVSIELYEDNILIAQGNLTRYPGSPNDQTLDLAYLRVNISRKYSAIIRYTPENDSINGQPNGANPCWVILRFSDQDEVRIHHTFNVQHPKTYIWEVDLAATILLHGITFEGTTYDPGSDDFILNWDFGDGTSITNFYPNLNKTFPVQMTETVTHVFPGSGTYIVTLTVEDDDGGVGVATITIFIP